MPPVHTTRLTPNCAKVKREARETYKRLVADGLIQVHGKRPTPKVTYESMVDTTGVTTTPESKKSIEAPTEDYPVGTYALFIPWFKENLSFSSRKVCRDLSLYPVQLTSSLTTKKNFQTKLLTSGETLRAPAGCFIFPKKISDTLVASLKKILEEGETRISGLIKAAYPSYTDACPIPGTSAVFLPSTREDVDDIGDICIPNRVYAVTMTGPIQRNKVPCKVDYLLKDSIKQKEFKAPRASLVLSTSSVCVNALIAEIIAYEQETHNKIVAFLGAETLPDNPYVDDLYDAPFEEPDEFLDTPPSEEPPEDDSADGPGEDDPIQPEFLPMDMHTENAYLRQMVADKKKIIELQNERYQDIKRINHANVLISVVGTFSKALDDILKDLAE